MVRPPRCASQRSTDFCRLYFLKMAGSPTKEDATEISSAELKDLAPKRAATAPASFPTSAAELQPMLESLRLKALPSFNQATSFMREQVASAGLRLARR